MFFESGGVRLFYEKTGGGPPLLLLHGNGENHHIFDKAIVVLQHHFTVYAVDTRGHGQSSPVDEYHYDDMAGDIYRFIVELGLQRPILYGFSDGGIVGLLLAVRHPGLLSHLVISGANTHPGGLKRGWQLFFKLIYAMTRSPKFRMMLNEPDISAEMLGAIDTPTHITAGSRDMISQRHTVSLHDNIPGSVLRIFENESHSSYIAGRDTIARYLVEILAQRAQ
jgi:pimeloyl-ACP methyl ester carboxylesterase